jgi:hypothetical protein
MDWRHAAGAANCLDDLAYGLVEQPVVASGG